MLYLLAVGCFLLGAASALFLIWFGLKGAAEAKTQADLERVNRLSPYRKTSLRLVQPRPVYRTDAAVADETLR
jgi:hypothetical protein